METTAPSQRPKRSRVTSEDDEAEGTGAARGSSRLASGIDDGAVAEEKPETFEEGDDEEAAFMEPDRSHGTPPPHALREIDFFYVCPPDDDAVAGNSCAGDQEELADVALTLGCKEPPQAAGREGTVDATLRLGLVPPSADPDPDVAALDEDDDLQLHLHGGVAFSASPAGPKLDPFWYPFPFADDPCNAPPPSPEDGGSFVVVPADGAFNSFVPTATGDDGCVVEFVTEDAIDRPSTALDLNQPCSSEFPDDIAADVDERPAGREAEQRHQSSSTPYTFI